MTHDRIDFPADVDQFIWQAIVHSARASGCTSAFEVLGQSRCAPVAMARRVVGYVLRRTVFYTKDNRNRKTGWRLWLGEDALPASQHPISTPALAAVFARDHSKFAYDATIQHLYETAIQEVLTLLRQNYPEGYPATETMYPESGVRAPSAGE